MGKELLRTLGTFRDGTFGDVKARLGTFVDIWGRLWTFWDVWGYLGTGQLETFRDVLGHDDV